MQVFVFIGKNRAKNATEGCPCKATEGRVENLCFRGKKTGINHSVSSSLSNASFSHLSIYIQAASTI